MKDVPIIQIKCGFIEITSGLEIILIRADRKGDPILNAETVSIDNFVWSAFKVVSVLELATFSLEN